MGNHMGNHVGKHVGKHMRRTRVAPRWQCSNDLP